MLIRPLSRDIVTVNEPTLSARRTFLGQASLVTLSAAAVGLLAGKSGSAFAASGSESQDVAILNVALGLEHEAITAYQLGAQSGLLQKDVLDVAVLFQSHHKAHRDALIGTIEKLGGTPVAARSTDEVAKALNAAGLKSQTDVLTLARKLEGGAANAYIGVIPSFKDSQLAKVAARLACDETLHWTVLSQTLGLALPAGALSFGA